MNNKTPRIACLGWGSLIWKPGELPIFDGWKTDGPMLPVEFARESGGQRITLVICDNVDPVRTCWTLLEAKDIGTAMSTLASREGISDKRVAMDIGYCDLSTGMHHGLRANDIAAWAAGHELDGVVWTNLPCGFKNSRHILPTGDQVVSYLQGLTGQAMDDAREYIERAPLQISTAYRSQISKELGWVALAI
ncbi:MAG: hypothetical protein PSV26_02775 [Polaromonas sp.]|uniref:hypothetical protein n=1 Tax=Polaromonas sp. TaxID=1869339 RepID=UPI0024897996|nr:hypothetical protein [Polaromonas sp.]MDI1236390.1 hypothetical protein [Polaromonas sp.]